MSLPLHSQQVTPQPQTGKVQATLDNLGFRPASCSLAPTRRTPSFSSAITMQVFLLLSAAETPACPLHPKPFHFLRNLLFPSSLFTAHLSLPSEILSSIYKNVCLSLIKTKQTSILPWSLLFSPSQPGVPLRSCLCLVSLILYLPYTHPHYISVHAINVFLKLHYQGHQWSPYCKILGHCALHSFPPLSGFDTIVHHLLNCFLCLAGLSFFLSSCTSLKLLFHWLSLGALSFSFLNLYPISSQNWWSHLWLSLKSTHLFSFPPPLSKPSLSPLTRITTSIPWLVCLPPVLSFPNPFFILQTKWSF